MSWRAASAVRDITWVTCCVRLDEDQHLAVLGQGGGVDEDLAVQQGYGGDRLVHRQLLPGRTCFDLPVAAPRQVKGRAPAWGWPAGVPLNRCGTAG